MIFTTNKPLRAWGKVLHDEDLAAAILDRVLERGRFIHLDGPSGRTGHLNLEETLPGTADRARISGIGPPQFPEPTRFYRGGCATLRWGTRAGAFLTLSAGWRRRFGGI